MSQTLIIAITLFTLLSTVASFWYPANRNRGNDRPDTPDPDPCEAGLEFGERRLAAVINEPRTRNRLNDQVARLLAVLAATSFAIAIASRYITSW